MSNITILGAGAMGSGMAKNLIEAGHAVTVYNRNHKNALTAIESGATFSPAPIAAVDQADIVISMLGNDEASKAVWLDDETGAIHGLKESVIAIESSTLSVAWVTQLAQNMAVKKISSFSMPR